MTEGGDLELGERHGEGFVDKLLCNLWGSERLSPNSLYYWLFHSSPNVI